MCHCQNISNNSIKVLGILSEEATLPFLPPFSVKVYSLRKEFAPPGANSFLQEKALCQTVTSSNEVNKKSFKFIQYYFRKKGRGRFLEQGHLYRLTRYFAHPG